MSLFCHYVRRGYPVPLIQKAFVKSASQSRESLLEKQHVKVLEESVIEPDLESSLYLTTTFNPEFNSLGEIVRKNWDLLKRSQATEILAETKVVVGYRRPPNLKDLLVQAKVPSLETHTT